MSKFVTFFALSLVAFFVLASSAIAQTTIQTAITTTATSAAVIANQTSTADASQEVNADENVSAQELGIPNPTLLPNSPFYFLKSWWHGVHLFFTFNPIKKAELRMNYASEHLLEAKKLAKETKDPKVIEKAMNNYEGEMNNIGKIVSQLKEKANQSSTTGKFLDKFIKQQILHQKILENLETHVPAQALTKIKAAVNRHLATFNEVMQKVGTKTNLPQRLEKAFQGIKGSQFKNFKNLEMLKRLENQASTTTKDVIQKVRSNIFKRIKEQWQKMSTSTQEKLKNYIGRIKGSVENKMDIIESIKSEFGQFPKIREKFNQMRDKILERVGSINKKIDCQEIQPPRKDFCQNGRIIPERNSKHCIVSFKCIHPQVINPQAKKRVACVAVFDPVCGVNGKVYSNSCWAGVAGVKVLHKGYCTGQEKIENNTTPNASSSSSGSADIGRLPKKIIMATCQIACQRENFKSSVCRKWPITPQAKWGCQNNEKNIGQTLDCYVPQGLVGIGKTCCCSMGNNK